MKKYIAEYYLNNKIVSTNEFTSKNLKEAKISAKKLALAEKIKHGNKIKTMIRRIYAYKQDNPNRRRLFSEPTTTIAFRVPDSHVEKLKEIINTYLDELRIDKK